MYFRFHIGFKVFFPLLKPESVISKAYIVFLEYIALRVPTLELICYFATHSWNLMGSHDGLFLFDISLPSLIWEISLCTLQSKSLIKLSHKLITFFSIWKIDHFLLSFISYPAKSLSTAKQILPPLPDWGSMPWLFHSFSSASILLLRRKHHVMERANYEAKPPWRPTKTWLGPGT